MCHTLQIYMVYIKYTPPSPPARVRTHTHMHQCSIRIEILNAQKGKVIVPRAVITQPVWTGGAFSLAAYAADSNDAGLDPAFLSHPKTPTGSKQAWSV